MPRALANDPLMRKERNQCKMKSRIQARTESSWSRNPWRRKTARSRSRDGTAPDARYGGALGAQRANWRGSDELRAITIAVEERVIPCCNRGRRDRASGGQSHRRPRQHRA
jgi:hypothetical protein